MTLFYKLWSLFIIGLVVENTSAKSGFFWHVTDFHYDPTYWTSQLSCNDDVPKPGPYGDYWCDSNWRLVEDAIQNMKAIKPDVDFIIWTGDSVAHIANNETTLESNIEIIKNITESINSNFPSDVRFLPSLGNHDFYPSDQADVKENDFYEKTALVWKEWIPDAEELKQYRNGGFYAVVLHNKLLLMAINTNFYYTQNHITGSMKDPAGQFAWMERVLSKARTNGQKVILTAHVTPGLVTPGFATWMYPKLQERYVAILIDYSDVIVATHYGHDHSDGFKIMQEKDDDSKAVTQFIAPSVTPWRYRIPEKTGSPHNPGIRLVEYDKQTGHHINYVQYYINLTETNMHGSSNWVKLYDFKETYNVTDMSVKSLRQIFAKMATDDDEGRSLAQVYCNNALVSKQDQTCTPENQFQIVCGGHLFRKSDALSCLSQKIGGGAPGIGLHIMGYLIAFTVTAITIILYF